MAHIRTETANGHGDCFAFILTNLARQFEQVKNFLKCDSLDVLVAMKRCELRLLVVLAVANLRHWAVAANLDNHWLAAFGMNTQNTLAVFAPRNLESAVYCIVERMVEFVYHLVPHHFAFCNIVEFLLNFGCEVIVENRREALNQIVIDNHTYVGWEEFALLNAVVLGLDFGLDFARFQCQNLVFAL